MPKTRTQKENTVKQLTDKLSEAKSVVFTDYKGMTMPQLSILRTELRDISAEFTVTKNNLLKIALNDSKLTVNDPRLLEGPIATLFAFGDEVSPIKSLTKAIKDFAVGSVKGGFLAGEFLEPARVNQLATLPTKDELRAKVVGSLGSPLYGIVGVLQANLRNLVYALEQIRKQKGGE